jgi:hypothetical protein
MLTNMENVNDIVNKKQVQNPTSSVHADVSIFPWKRSSLTG